MKWIKTYESVQSQKILEKLYIDILKLMANKTFEYCIKENDGVKYLDSIGGADLRDLDLTKYDEETVKFIKESKLFVSAKKNIPSSFGEGSSKGSYDKYYRTIHLHLRQEFLDKLNKELANPAKYGDFVMELTPDRLYFDLWYEFSSTLLHELQHAWDDWKSKGGYTRNKKFFKYASEIDNLRYHKYNINKRLSDIQKSGVNDEEMDKEKEKVYADDFKKKNKVFKQYRNMQHEINARFTQAIQKTRFVTLDKDNHNKKIRKPFAEVLKDFTLEFEGWRDLSDNNKLRLTKRLSQFWSDKPKVEIIKPTTDEDIEDND